MSGVVQPVAPAVTPATTVASTTLLNKPLINSKQKPAIVTTPAKKIQRLNGAKVIMSNNCDKVFLLSKFRFYFYYWFNTRSTEVDHITWTTMWVQITYMGTSLLSWFQLFAIDSFWCGFVLSWCKKVMSYFQQQKKGFSSFTI